MPVPEGDSTTVKYFVWQVIGVDVEQVGAVVANPGKFPVVLWKVLVLELLPAPPRYATGRVGQTFPNMLLMQVPTTGVQGKPELKLKIGLKSCAAVKISLALTETPVRSDVVMSPLRLFHVVPIS